MNNAELPTYTTTTAADGGFSIDSVWAGRYHVWAEKEGYNRKRIGENVIVSQDSTVDIADDADVLSQQTGDFLINEGASFTNLANVTLYLTLNDISEFRIRTNDGAFSDWIQWSDEDQDGAMLYGTNDEVLLPPIEDEADNGDRLVEIETRNLEGINSGAPYYQATIRLDIDPPLGTRLQFTGSNVTATDDTIYTNASLGEVTLDLLAEDANWEPDIPGVTREV